MKKHCDTCIYSYQSKDRDSLLPFRKLRQHCRNPHYNAPTYTHTLFMEDREKDYCRFWAPGAERKAS